VEEVGSSEKVSLSEKVVLVLLALEVGVVKEGSGFLPSRRFLGPIITACAIKAGVVEVDSRSCCQGECGFLKQVQRRIGIASVSDSLHGAIMVGRAVTGTRGSWFVSCSTGRSGLGSLRAL
jgi:hypothetical protein